MEEKVDEQHEKIVVEHSTDKGRTKISQKLSKQTKLLNNFQNKEKNDHSK